MERGYLGHLISELGFFDSSKHSAALTAEPLKPSYHSEPLFVTLRARSLPFSLQELPHSEGIFPAAIMAATANSASAPPRQLSQKEEDIQMMLAAEVHLGTKNCDFQMERYIFKRRFDG